MTYSDDIARLAKLETIVVPELIDALECAIVAFVDGGYEFEVPTGYGSAEEYLKATLAEHQPLREAR